MTKNDRLMTTLIICFILILFVICFILTIHTHREQIEIKKQRKKEVDTCIAMGGIPIRGQFNSAVMIDCKFKPKQ
jgi:preprotein translocase subunit SecG